MTYIKTPPSKKKVESLKEKVYTVINSESYRLWRANAIKSLAYYQGAIPPNPHQDSLYEELGQKRRGVNRIDPLVNSIRGQEIKTKKRIIFKPQGKNEWVTRVVGAMTSQALIKQEETNYIFKNSDHFLNSLIYGVSWAGFQRNILTGNVEYEAVNPLDIIFDIYDNTEDLCNSEFVARLGYISLSEAVNVWPKFKRQLEEMATHYVDQRGMDLRGDIAGNWDNWCFGDDTRKMIKYVEIQHKEVLTAYEGTTEKRYYGTMSKPEKGQKTTPFLDINELQTRDVFKTFDKEEALFLSGEDELKTVKSTAMRKSVICGELLLEDYYLDPFLPDMQDFSWVPLVHSKDVLRNIPVGMVEKLIPVQDDYNFTYTMMMKNVDSSLTILNANAVKGGDEESIKRQLRSRNGVILKSDESTIQHITNENKVRQYQDHLQGLDTLFQTISGCYNDAVGKQSNAQSGVAIERRQENSFGNLIFMFNGLRLSRIREGKRLLALLQTDKNTIFECDVYGAEKQDVIDINYFVATEREGRRIINDVSFLPAGVYIDEIDDYASTEAHDKDLYKIFLQSPEMLPYLTVPEFCQTVMGFLDYNTAAANFKKIYDKVNGVQQEGQPQEQQQPTQEQSDEQLLRDMQETQGFDEDSEQEYSPTENPEEAMQQHQQSVYEANQ